MPSSQHRRTSRGHRPSLSGSDATESAKSGNIRVVVRIRPPNAAELEKGSGSRPVVEMLDEKLLVFDPKEDTPPSYFHGRRMARRNFMQRKNKDVKFAFDQVFSERVTQQYVYENTTRAIVDSVLAGYNASVFAYGATGAGKTFTMLGAPECPGVIFLTMVDLYRRIGEIAQDKLCDVAVSYLEVYNENIRDLLAPSGLLALREDPQKGVVVSGLTLHKPRSAEELLRMLEFGNGNRTQHPTDANAQSSRSHAVFQVFVRQKDRTANISTNFRIAKMSLIDLAGSERATATTNRGARFREGANINRSLLALGNCINALADNKKSKGQHIPYRNSKLTRLLKDSLGGNCQTVMIAAISPSSLTYEDTLNTLKYASRAKNIRTSLKQNVVNVDLHISRYTKIVEELRTEVSELKIKLQTYESGSVVMPVVPTCDISDERIHRLQAELHKVFAQRCSKRKELLELESSDRHLTILISRKQSMAERIRLVYGGSTQGDKTMGRFERHIAASVARQTRLRERKPAVEDRIKTNQESLDRVKGQIEVEWGQDQIPMVLQESVRTRHLEVELKDCRRQIKHLKRFARQQDNHQQSSERLITSLLTTVRKQFYLLKGSGLATSDVMTDFEAIQKQVEGDREVAWADQSVSEVAEVKPTSSNGEIDLNYLLELPIMKCVESTPKVPMRSPRKSNGHLSSSCTPARAPSTPLPGRRGTPMQVGTPAGRVPCPNPIIGHPPSRVETPRPGTPYARRNTANRNTIDAFEPISDGRRPDTPRAVTKICNTENGRLISDTTPDNSWQENGIVAAGSGIPQCNGVPQCIGQTVTKSQLSVTQAAEMDDARRDLAATFNMEGVQALSSPAISETSTKPALKSVTHVTCSDQSEASSSHHSEGESSSATRDSHKTVAREIIFNQENTTPNQKISPTTGRIMSYAEALATPQRLDSSGQQRAPFAVLTNNSPQLPNRHRNNKSQRLFNDAKDRCLSQSTSKTVKRNAHRRGTFTKTNPSLHRRTKSQGVLGERTFSHQGANNNAETLRRFGLPSMSDQPISVGQKRPMPAYMSLTASAAHKRRNYNRGFQSSQENQPPAMRLQRMESTIKPAVRIPSFSRSRSTSNLSGK